jgi:hypothetical protein
MDHWAEINILNWGEGSCVNSACVFGEIFNLVACWKFHGCGCVADFSPCGRSIYMDHDPSIKLGDGGRSEEKRPKYWEVGVGQRRRGCYAVSSKQSN